MGLLLHCRRRGGAPGAAAEGGGAPNKEFPPKSEAALGFLNFNRTQCPRQHRVKVKGL